MWAGQVVLTRATTALPLRDIWITEGWARGDDGRLATAISKEQTKSSCNPFVRQVAAGRGCYRVKYVAFEMNEIVSQSTHYTRGETDLRH